MTRRMLAAGGREDNIPYQIDPNLLGRLRRDPSNWHQLVSFSPTAPGDALSDVNLRSRTQILLTLHTEHFHCPDPGLGPPRADEALVAYLLNQEIRLHQHHKTVRNALNLACFLLARYRKPAYVWAVWAAKNSGPYEALICVDIHYLYYAAGGIAAARRYVETSTLDDVLEGARAGGAWESWWSAKVYGYGGNAARAFLAEKTELLQRILRDSVSLTDEHIVQFISSPIRTDTDRWADYIK